MIYKLLRNIVFQRIYKNYSFGSIPKFCKGTCCLMFFCKFVGNILWMFLGSNGFVFSWFFSISWLTKSWLPELGTLYLLSISEIPILKGEAALVFVIPVPKSKGKSIFLYVVRIIGIYMELLFKNLKQFGIYDTVHSTVS